jgi:hypothetical protein
MSSARLKPPLPPLLSPWQNDSSKRRKRGIGGERWREREEWNGEGRLECWDMSSRWSIPGCTGTSWRDRLPGKAGHFPKVLPTKGMYKSKDSFICLLTFYVTVCFG